MKVAQFLAFRKNLSFGWFIIYDEIVGDREKITYMQSGNTILERGRGFVSRSERGNTLRDYYFDGAVFSGASPSENFYASAMIDSGFDTLAKAVRERSDTILPLWSILSESLPDELLDDVERGAYLGTTLIGGTPVHHLAISEAEEDWQVWISTDEEAPLPLMLIGVDKTKTSWPQWRV